MDMCSQTELLQYQRLDVLVRTLHTFLLLAKSFCTQAVTVSNNKSSHKQQATKSFCMQQIMRCKSMWTQTHADLCTSSIREGFSLGCFSYPCPWPVPHHFRMKNLLPRTAQARRNKRKAQCVRISHNMSCCYCFDCFVMLLVMVLTAHVHSNLLSNVIRSATILDAPAPLPCGDLPPCVH